MNVIFNKFTALIGFASMTVGIIASAASLYQYLNEKSIAHFSGEIRFYSASGDNHKLIEFLRDNNENIVFLNLYLDFSEPLQEHYIIAKNCDPYNDYEKGIMVIPTSINDNDWSKECDAKIRLNFNMPIGPTSTAGTGIDIDLERNFFIASTSFHSGHIRIFNLEKQSADPKLWAEMSDIR